MGEWEGGVLNGEEDVVVFLLWSYFASRSIRAVGAVYRCMNEPRSWSSHAPANPSPVVFSL